MGKSFKDLSFGKKTLSVFVIAIGVVLLSVFTLFALRSVSEFGNFAEIPAGEPNSLDNGGVYVDEYSSESDVALYGSNSKSSSDTQGGEERLSKDVSVEIGAKDIMGTIDLVLDTGRQYDAVYDSCYAGDSGWGYLDLEVPSDKVDDFVQKLRDEYNVVSYNYSLDNVVNDEVDIDRNIERLEERLASVDKALKEARENGEDYSLYQDEYWRLEDQIYSYKQMKEDVGNSVVYSDVHIEVRDENYTEYHVFDGVWLAIKTGAHSFILGLIYGLYLILYVFVMIYIIKVLRNVLRRIGNINPRVVRSLKAETAVSNPVSDDMGGAAEVLTEDKDSVNENDADLFDESNCGKDDK